MPPSQPELRPATQWDQVEALDVFPIISDARRKSQELRVSLAKMAGTTTIENCVVTIEDTLGQRQRLSVTEYVELLERQARATHGISYAGEIPAWPGPEPKEAITSPNFPA